MVLADGEGVPLRVRLESASPAEVTLAEATLAEIRVPRPKGRPRQKPERVIADRGFDSDPLRQRLKQLWKLRSFRKKRITVFQLSCKHTVQVAGAGTGGQGPRCRGATAEAEDSLLDQAFVL